MYLNIEKIGTKSPLSQKSMTFPGPFEKLPIFPDFPGCINPDITLNQPTEENYIIHWMRAFSPF